MLKSHLRDLVALRLENCRRLTVNGLFNSIRQKSMPSLLRLHAYWFDNGDVFGDVELWRSFAADEDIKVDTQVEGIVWLTALKETSPEMLAAQQHRERERATLPNLPQPAYLGQVGGLRYLAPPQAPMSNKAGSSSSSSSYRHRRKKRHQGSTKGRRRQSDDSSDSSSKEDSEDESSSGGSDSDDSVNTDYHSSRSRRSRSPACRSGGSSHRSRRHRH